MVKQFCLKTASGIAAAVMLFALPQSCVNEEYDISKIDTTVSFGGDAMVFPLGSTARLTLKTLLPEEDFDYITSQLQGQDEGVYGFSMSGEMNDLGDAIPDISEMLSIADMEVNPEPIEYKLNYNMDGMKIDETVFPEPDGTGSNPGEISFDSLKDMPDIDEMMPTEPIKGPSVTVETAKYYPTEDQLDMSAHFPEVRIPETDYITLYNLASLKSVVDLLPVEPDETIGSESIPSDILEDIANIGLGEERFVKVNLHVEMPEGISDISNVSFGENAEMTVTTTVNNSFLTGGSIVPHITINGLGNLVLIDDPAFSASSDGGALDLSGLALEVNEASPSTVISDSKTYRLAGLPDLPWNGNILDMTDQKITVDGYLSIQDVKTTKNMIGAPALGDELEVAVEIVFSNVVVDDMTMNVNDITGSVPAEGESSDIDLNIGTIDLPDQIVSVGEVTMDNSWLVMDIVSENLSGLGAAGAENPFHAKLDRLTINFPGMIGFGTYQGNIGRLEGNTFTAENVDLTVSNRISLPVESINPGTPADGQIVMDGKVTVEAGYSAGGMITLAGLRGQSGTPQDAGIKVTVTPDLHVGDFALEMKRLEQELDIDEDFSMSFDEEVADLGVINVIPDSEKKITVTVSNPVSDYIHLTGENLKITFPDMIRFKDTQSLPAEYGYDETDNSLNMNGTLPENIELVIDHIVIDPEADPDNQGSYVAGGRMTVTGKVFASTGETSGSGLYVLHKDAVDALKNAADAGQSISISGVVPGLSLDECTVNIQEFKYQIADRQEEVTLFDTSELPDGIESLKIKEVLLSGGELSLDVTAGLPEALKGAKFVLSADVTLPDEILIDDPRVVQTEYGKVLHLEGTITNGRYELDPVIKISGLDMSDIVIVGDGAESSIKRMISITGSISAANTYIENPGSLNGQTVTINVDGGIKNIRIDEITGNIGYVLKPEEGATENPLEQRITLEGLPDFVKGDDFVLDFTNPYILVNVTSNVGIPIKGSIVITPEYGSQAGTPLIIDDVVIPRADNAAEPKTTSFWISSPEDNNVPSSYTHLGADIASLLTKIPDALNLKVDVSTDESSEFIVEGGDDIIYDIALDYDVVVPFEFGEDLSISMEYTFPGESDEESGQGQTSAEGESGTLPPVVGELLNMNSLGLGGSVTSSLPLQLKLDIELLDSEKGVIPTEPITTTIAAGSDEEPSVSEIDAMVRLAEGADGTDLSYIKMKFTVTSGNMTGKPVTDKSYIQADLKVKVPGGVTIDLSSLGESENTTDGSGYSGTEN